MALEDILGKFSTTKMPLEDLLGHLNTTKMPLGDLSQYTSKEPLKADHSQGHSEKARSLYFQGQLTGTTFESFNSTAESSIKGLQHSVPAPTTLTEAFTYILTYIEHGRRLSQTTQERYESLEKQYRAVKDQVSTDLVELTRLRKETSSQRIQITQLSDALRLQKSMTEKLQDELNKHVKGDAKKSDAEATREAQTKKEIERIQQELEITKVRLHEESDKAQGEIANLKQQLSQEKTKNTRLEEEASSLKTKFAAQTQELQACRKTHTDITTELEGAKHQHEVDAHIIAGLQAEKDALKKAIADAEAKAKAPKEPEKPVLPNDVTLRNPIALTGGLSGAPKDVDDEFFPLDVPFVVKLWDHASQKLFITDNGMLCLDKGTNARQKRMGEVLPHRDSIPEYTLLPFWTDLKITKGKPHGIYWEIVGQAPARSLTVEWYVTRYSQESQYFHFNLLLEEAKPNIVTYKYYDTAAEGNHTIGIQGPNSYKMYSHDRKGAYKGVQLVFDTKANTVQESSFPIGH